MSKILVTGGLGTVGTCLVSELRSRGNDVWIIDLPHHHDPKYLRCDVRNYRQLLRVFNVHKFDYVYHLAAEFGRHNGEDYYDTLWETNVVGTKNLINLQELLGFKLIFASSSEVYGDYDGVLSEDLLDRCEIRQLNDYALTKWVSEIQIMNSEKMNHTDTVRMRLFNLYGPGEHYSPYRSVISVFCYRLLNGLPITVYRGHNRTSTYIWDAIYAIANISESFRPGDVYNIGGGDFHDIETIAEYVLFHTGARRSLINYKEAEPFTTKNKLIDNTNAREILGFRVSVSLDEGIRRTVNWMRDEYQIGE